MTDRLNHKRSEQVNKHTNEARDFSREHAERKEAPSFIEQPMRDAGLLQVNDDLKKGADGKLILYERNQSIEGKETIETIEIIDPKSLKENLPSVQYEQIKYNMMKRAVSDAKKLDVERIKEVQKVEDGYTYKYDRGNGQELQEGKLSSGDEVIKQEIAKFEKHMADYGFPIEEPKSDSIKQAVLKNAAATVDTLEEKELIENGAVQSYDAEHEKWYISKNGKIEEFSLDKQKVEENAELNGVKKYLEMENRKKVDEAKFKNDQHDQYEVKGANSHEWETIAKEGVDPGIMKKIMGEKMINPDSHVTVVESKETGEEAKLKKIDKLIDNLKDERLKLENWGKLRKKILTGAIFLNQGAAQANQNLNIIEEALRLGNGNNGNQPATILNSDKFFRLIDDKHKGKVKLINEQIGHLDKLKVKVEKHKNKLEAEIKKYEQLKKDFSSSQKNDKENQDPNRKLKQGDD